jgi:hypothetical protein
MEIAAMKFGSFRCALVALATAGVLAGCADPTASQQSGRVAVHLTDGPFPFASVRSVDLFIVRVDARADEVTDADVAAGLDDEQSEENGWLTLTQPMQKLDLLSLRDGTHAMIGEAELPAGQYRALRLVIDPTQSSITLKNGMVLDATYGIAFPSGSRLGLKVKLKSPIRIKSNQTSSVLVDFDVGKSFVLRGSSIVANGLQFRPVIKGLEQ